MEKTGNKNIEQRPGVLNSEMSEFISKKPHWIIHFGSIIFLFVLIITILGSVFIKYPDINSVPANMLYIKYDLNKQYALVEFKKEYAGKFEKNQFVLIKSASYSISEKGIISEINTISSCDSINYTTARIELNNKLSIANEYLVSCHNNLPVNIDATGKKISLFRRILKSIFN